MKRNLLIAAIALLAVAFVACQKDGVYKPKKRINKIYKESVTTRYITEDGKSRSEIDSVKSYPAEEWTWGDKTLESIIRKDSEGRIYSTEKYTYDDKNRIVGISDGDDKVEFVYNDDKKLQSIKTFDGTDLVLSVEYAYEDKLPKTVTSTLYYEFKKVPASAKMVIPTFVVEELERTEIQSKTVHTYVTTSTIEWDGKNISKVVNTPETGTPTTYTYEYDGKTNPYKGMFASMDYEAAFSKNNIIKETKSYTEDNKTITEVDEYTYEYDGKMPIKMTISETRERDMLLGGTVKTTTVNTTTFEYAK